MTKKSRILVVEDSRFFKNLVTRSINQRIDAEVVSVMTLAETKDAVNWSLSPFNLALVDVVLPDAPEGEAVDWLLEQGVPSIVFTGVFSEDLRERLLAQHVIDYVVKDTPSSLDYLVGLVEQLHNNQDTKVLVVDDSKSARLYISSLLRSYQFQVFTAASGKGGLAELEANPDIRLVITDYHMPEMDGVEMVKRMRMTHNQEHLAIIGISSGGGSALSAKFIKFGANDFINKPFLREEFFCRVMQNVRMLDLVRRLSDMSILDALTGIHNRRFLFDAGVAVLAKAERIAESVTVAMVDVDHFKAVNDTFGHDGGDAALRHVAQLLRHGCRQADIVARFGGEEFAIVAVGMDDQAVMPFFEKLRMAIANASVIYDKKAIPLTASLGVCHGRGMSLDAMLKYADAMLFKAKSNGRDRVEVM